MSDNAKNNCELDWVGWAMRWPAWSGVIALGAAVFFYGLASSVQPIFWADVKVSAIVFIITWGFLIYVPWKFAKETVDQRRDEDG